MTPDQPPLPDQHTIETPEQTALAFRLAGIGTRFLALAVDTAIQATALILALVTLAFFGLFGQQSVWALAAAGAFLFLLMYGYFIIFEILWNGQTPGKRILGIRVVKDSGRPLNPTEIIGRNLMRIVDQLPGFYAVGMVTSMLNPENRRLGDFVAGSIVVRESAFTDLRPVWQSTQAGAEPLDPMVAAMLTAEDLVLIDTFLHRREDLRSDVRARMAEEILGKLRERRALPPMTGTPENILESLAYLRRSSGGYS